MSEPSDPAVEQIFADHPVMIDYINWVGERRIRSITPVELIFGATEYHRRPQYLLRAIDNETGIVKEFAMRDIKAWNVNIDSTRPTTAEL